MLEFLKIHQQKLALAIGYVLVFLLAFALGKISVTLPNPPDIKVEEPEVSSQSNNTSEVQGMQSQTLEKSETAASALPAVGGAFSATTDGQCAGKIKGNISSSGKIYHLPGGSFYNRTVAEMCFETEAAAQVAGFRKSTR